MRTKLLLTAGALAAAALASSAQAATNLVANGDFSGGVSGFTSDYSYSPGNGVPPAVYDVGTNPNAIHPSWASFGDHTTGAGNMLIVNGSETPGAIVWGENGITVDANTNYVFSTWIASTYAVSPAQLDFSINGVAIGPTFTASSTTGAWQLFQANWNSGASTTANIALVNQNLAFTGNDFALDDIGMSAAPGVPEPTSWALMLVGFTGLGAMLRHRRARLALAA
jgi:hypothetical protein